MALHWRLQLRDTVELVVPALAVVLPWPLCFRLFGWLAKCEWFYREATHRAVEHARQMGWLGADEREWARRRRLVTLIDHADFFLALTRSNAWLKRYVKVQGQWPNAAQSALLVTFHWGASMWALRHAKNHGIHAHFLLASTDKSYFKDRPVLCAYATARKSCCDRELGRLTLDTSLNLRHTFTQILTDKEQIMAVVDVPADSFDIRQSVTVLGNKAQVPNGLMRLAVERQVPVHLFLTDIDFETGRRTLTIRSLGYHENVDDLAGSVFALLDEAIRLSPPSWHFWSEANRFFDLGKDGNKVSADNPASPNSATAA